MSLASSAAAPRSALRPWLDRWGRLLLVVVSLSLIAALGAARTAAMRHGLRGYQEAHSADFRTRDFPGLSARELVLLGTAHSTGYRPAGSYTLVPEAKPPGTIRIGVFGCSFVRGAEVAQGADFPSRLGARLADLGLRDVEVINFGVGGYGMHQSVLLWELLGRRYDLDYTIFHLYPFHEGRDASFIQNPNAFAPVHSRYVLRGGEAVRVDPLGETRLEAAEIYSRFLTPWRYARYDSHGPAFLRALLPRGKTLGDNPLYYYAGDAAAESEELYPALFARVVEAGARNVIVTCNGAGCRHAEALRERGVEVLPLHSAVAAHARPTLYRAPRGHLSALGNELVAGELAAGLSGRRARLPVLAIEPLDAYPPARGPARLRPEHQPTLWIGSRRVGTFVDSASPRKPFRSRGAQALLDVSSGQEIVFLPLAEPIAGGERLELGFRLDGDPVTVAVGEVEAASPVLGRPRWLDAVGGDGWAIAEGAIDPTGELTLLTEREVSGLTITLAGRPLLRGEELPSPEGARLFRLRPAGAAAVPVRSDAPGVLSVRGLPARCTVDLVLTHRDAGRDLGPAARIPVAACRRRAIRLDAPRPPLARPLPAPAPDDGQRSGERSEGAPAGANEA